MESTQHDVIGYNPEMLEFIIKLLETQCSINEILYLRRIEELLPHVISISQSALSADNPIMQSDNKSNVSWYHSELTIRLSKYLLSVPMKDIVAKKDEWCKKWGLINVMVKISLEPPYDKFLESVIIKYLNDESIKALNTFSTEKKSRVFVKQNTQVKN